jgi:glutaredoxin 3
MGVVIYTKPGCPYSAAAKNDLISRGVDYEEVDVTTSQDAMDTLSRLTGGEMLVPVLVEGGEVRIGYGGG